MVSCPDVCLSAYKPYKSTYLNLFESVVSESPLTDLKVNAGTSAFTTLLDPDASVDTVNSAECISLLLSFSSISNTTGWSALTADWRVVPPAPYPTDILIAYAVFPVDMLYQRSEEHT